MFGSIFWMHDNFIWAINRNNVVILVLFVHKVHTKRPGSRDIFTTIGTICPIIELSRLIVWGSTACVFEIALLVILVGYWRFENSLYRRKHVDPKYFNVQPCLCFKYFELIRTKPNSYVWEQLVFLYTLWNIVDSNKCFKYKHGPYDYDETLEHD